MSDPTEHIVDSMLPHGGKHCPHAYKMLKEDQLLTDLGIRTWSNAKGIRIECPFCHSLNTRVGCPYTDCETCTDIETSSCNKCHSAWAGSMYWK